MIVLSLFDGMSCGQIALRDMGIPVTRYYASEVDKFAVHNTLHNFPATIMLGDVRNVSGKQMGKVDLLMGGSPCQSFSFSGKRVGMKAETSEEITTLARYMELKQGGFQFLGQSYLFWEYVRILNELRENNPNVLFLLENVEMGKNGKASSTTHSESEARTSTLPWCRHRRGKESIGQTSTRKRTPCSRHTTARFRNQPTVESRSPTSSKTRCMTDTIFAMRPSRDLLQFMKGKTGRVNSPRESAAAPSFRR